MLFRVALAVLKTNESTLLQQDNVGLLLREVRQAVTHLHDRDKLMKASRLALSTSSCGELHTHTSTLQLASCCLMAHLLELCLIDVTRVPMSVGCLCLPIPNQSSTALHSCTRPQAFVVTHGNGHLVQHVGAVKYVSRVIIRACTHVTDRPCIAASGVPYCVIHPVNSWHFQVFVVRIHISLYASVLFCIAGSL